MRYLLILICLSIASSIHTAPGNLAYIHNDRLYIKVLPDGRPIKLADDVNARRPRWSPSGCWIAYSADGKLKIVHISGRPIYTITDIADIDSYSWSPQSDRLAYITKGRSLRVLTPSPKGLDGRTMISNKSGDQNNGVESYAWSPNGKEIAYTRTTKVKKTPHRENMPGLSSSVCKIDSDGSGTKTLLNAGANTFLPVIACWSPDGRWILYWRDDMYAASLMADGLALEAVPSAGGKSRELVDEMLTYKDFISFSPNGTKLVASAKGNRYSWTDKNLEMVDIKTGASKTLTSENELALSPSWSPRGDKIAYVSAPDQPSVEDVNKVSLNSRDINILDPKTGLSKQISKNKLCRYEYPRWSSDGTRLLFVRVDRENKAIVWIVKADGSSPVEASEELGPDTNGWPGYYGYVDWSDYLDWWQR